jgi:hypothetical protein
MRIIFCYSSSPELRSAAAIRRYAPKAEWVKTEGLFGYGEAIASRWTGESDLVVIEGDKEINADVIPSFEDCNEPWCTYGCKTFPPPFRVQIDYGLSCAKFSADLQKQVDPSEFICEDVPWQPCRYCGNKGCWNQLDVRMGRAFESHDVDYPHVHGHIKHHHVYDDTWYRERQKNIDYLMDADARIKEIRDWHEKNGHLNAYSK